MRGTGWAGRLAGSLLGPNAAGIEEAADVAGNGTDAVSFFPHVLREYALVADGERGGLIGPHGELTWMCAPRWDSDAVFSALIGGDGAYAVTPADPRHVWGGYYEPGSLIWRNRWVTTDTVIECREALAFPGDPGRLVLLRQVHAVRGDARMRVILDPRAGFGRHGSQRLARDNGIWSGHSGPLRWRWQGGSRARPRQAAHAQGELLVLDLTVPAGQRHDLVLEIGEGDLGADPPDPGGTWRATEAAWARARPSLEDTIAPRDAQHAWAVLRGLTSAGGGMAAAATMSLPERADVSRNYDYRYAWIRDQAYAGIAAAAAGAPDLLDAATAFVTARLLDDGPHLKPAYTVDGGPVPAERSLNLAGYPGGTDKTGNWVTQQFQLDALGEALQLLASAARADRLGTDGWQAIRTATDAVAKRWTEPDAGIWELDNRCWTHSRLACVAGLRAVAALPPAGNGLGEAATLADAILAETAKTATHADGYWQRCPDDPRPDAALLLPPVRGALPGGDPRTVATVRAVRDHLAEEEYVYRFRHDRRPLGDAEGAFLLCGFIMALAEHQQGNALTAVRYFERNRAACGPPGLLSEEYDVAQRQLRGNFPQAFVHALLLECAARLPGGSDSSG
ncbi:MAG: glycoside hydrolase family 15 protein [Streptosporangiaceae bacterium]|nr:glycoside hydrolase family 15 protein [Streptosporangiaceae bacterium]